jgi:hypothetical protein
VSASTASSRARARLRTPPRRAPLVRPSAVSARSPLGTAPHPEASGGVCGGRDAGSCAPAPRSSPATAGRQSAPAAAAHFCGAGCARRSANSSTPCTTRAHHRQGRELANLPAAGLRDAALATPAPRPEPRAAHQIERYPLSTRPGPPGRMIASRTTAARPSIPSSPDRVPTLPWSGDPRRLGPRRAPPGLTRRRRAGPSSSGFFPRCDSPAARATATASATSVAAAQRRQMGSDR